MALAPWYDLARPCLDVVEPDFFRPEKYFRNSPVNHVMQHFLGDNPFRDLMKPIEQISSALSQMGMKDIDNITEDEDKFQVNVDVRHFAPEEVNVKIIDRHIYIEGKHEEKRDHHGYVSRQFVRRYALPSGCLPDTVQSTLSSDGVLTVTAPRVLPLPSPGERIVPIKYTGPVQKQIGFSA